MTRGGWLGWPGGKERRDKLAATNWARRSGCCPESAVVVALQDAGRGVIALVDGADEGAEWGNCKLRQRHEPGFRLRGGKEHFCGSCFDAEGGEIELQGARLGAHVQHN